MSDPTLTDEICKSFNKKKNLKNKPSQSGLTY